jgi:hypothetical protein
MVSTSEQDEIVEKFEVKVIMCEKHSVSSDRVH